MSLTPVQNSELRIRVLVADTIAMSCHMLADALRRSPSFQAAAAATPKRVLQLLEKGEFDVVVIGIGFSGDPLQSIRFIRQMRNLRPQLGVVVLLDVLDRTLVVEAFRAGTLGIFSRSNSFEALCKCLRCVHEGQVWASSSGLQFVLEALVENGSAVPRPVGSRALSKREEQITFLVAEGFSNRQISERLELSEHTVKNYLFRVFEKIGVTTRVGLTLYALNQGKASLDKLSAFKPMPLPDRKLSGLQN